MKIIEEKLLDVILSALSQEHDALLGLRDEHKHHSILFGVFDLPEPVLVYVIYKELLRSDSFKGYSLTWEDTYSRSAHSKESLQYVDLSIENMSGRKTDYVEFGKFSAKKVTEDCRKLLDHKPDYGDKYLVLFHSRKEQEKTLDTRIEEAILKSNGGIRKCKIVHSCKSFTWNECPEYRNRKKTGDYPRVFEIALLKIE